MRKLLVLAAFAAVTSATALHAQGGPPDRPMRGMGRGGRGGPGAPGMALDRALFEGITLTDEQKSKLDQIRQAEREQMRSQAGGREEMQAIREAREKGDTATANRLIAEQRAKMQARMDAQIAAFRAILTEDQVARFDANVAELKKRQAEMGPGREGRGMRGRGGRPTPPPDR